MGCFELAYTIASVSAGMVSRFKEAATSHGLENHTSYRRFLFSRNKGCGVYGLSWMMNIHPYHIAGVRILV